MNYKSFRRTLIFSYRKKSTYFCKLIYKKSSPYYIDFSHLREDVCSAIFVKKIKEGALGDQTKMRDGFIIVKINNTDIKNLGDLDKALSAAKTFTLSGFYPGYDGLYDYPISLDND